jgi:predicted  nucleic acid-binding Zn-ribbon protein
MRKRGLVLLIIIVAVGVSGCFNAKEKKEIAELTARVAALQEENGRLSESMRELQTEKQNLENQLETARRELQKLRQLSEAISQVLDKK